MSCCAAGQLPVLPAGWQTHWLIGCQAHWLEARHACRLVDAAGKPVNCSPGCHLNLNVGLLLTDWCDDPEESALLFWHLSANWPADPVTAQCCSPATRGQQRASSPPPTAQRAEWMNSINFFIYFSAHAHTQREGERENERIRARKGKIKEKLCERRRILSYFLSVFLFSSFCLFWALIFESFFLPKLFLPSLCLFL